MTITVYAGATRNHEVHGAVISPVFHSSTWEFDFAHENETGGVTYLPNLYHVPHAGMEMATGNAYGVFQALGLELDTAMGSKWPIDQFQTAVMEEIMKNNQVQYVRDKLLSLMAMTVKGRSVGATVIVAH
jgi:hypothetical protein